MGTAPVTSSDVHKAWDRIRPHVLRTPLFRSSSLSRRAGGEVWLKLESQQRTGSFKPRGALNKLLTLDGAARGRGLVAASAGNHALGVAYACQVVGAGRPDLFVQATASPAKIAKLEDYAATLHLVGQNYDDAERAALDHVRETGATYLSPTDDPEVIAGHGTCGLEIVEDLPEVDLVVVPVGGGALSAGIALAVKSARPGCRVIGVNPAASPSALLSFQKGYAHERFEHGPTLAHGLAGGYGRLPFEVARSLIEEIVLVTEEELKQGIAALIDSDQVLAEPSGVAAVAALLASKVPRPSGRVVAVVSGGNIDTGTLRSALG